MPRIRSRHHDVLAEISGFLTVEVVDESYQRKHMPVDIHVTRMPVGRPADLLGYATKLAYSRYMICLKEFPVISDYGEYVLLHEIAHVVLGHCEPGRHLFHTTPNDEWAAEVWTMLRRPKWAGWIADEVRPRIRAMCEEIQEPFGGVTSWWRQMCLDVGFTPLFKGATFYE
jgi:hypothetical protein